MTSGEPRRAPPAGRRSGPGAPFLGPAAGIAHRVPRPPAAPRAPRCVPPPRRQQDGRGAALPARRRIRGGPRVSDGLAGGAAGRGGGAGRRGEERGPARGGPLSARCLATLREEVAAGP